MPTYHYIGRDESGEVVEGKLRAVSAEAVAGYLSQKNIIPIKIEQTTNRIHFSFERLAKINISFGAPVSNLEIMAFSRNMATMLEAGVPIIQALQELGRSSENSKFQKALFDIVDRIQEGETLASAMKKHPRIFSLLSVNTVEIGESSGNLPISFYKFADYLEMEDRNSKKLKSALRYPKIVLFSIIIAVFVINIFVIPSFKGLFGSFGADLPLATRMLMTTSEFIIGYWHVLILLLVAFIFLAKALLKNSKFRYAWDHLKLRMPIIGSLTEKILLTRVTWSIALIIKSGVSILECIQLVSESTSNMYMRKKIEQIKEKIKYGRTFSTAVKDVNLCDTITVQKLIIGEESGKLEEILEKIAQEYDAETEFELKKLADAIEPIMLLVLGGMVAVLALAIFLPMWEMSQHAIK